MTMQPMPTTTPGPGGAKPAGGKPGQGGVSAQPMPIDSKPGMLPAPKNPMAGGPKPKPLGGIGAGAPNPGIIGGPVNRVPGPGAKPAGGKPGGGQAKPAFLPQPNVTLDSLMNKVPQAQPMSAQPKVTTPSGS